jgi:hypothetical protein
MQADRAPQGGKAQEMKSKALRGLSEDISGYVRLTVGSREMLIKREDIPALTRARRFVRTDEDIKPQPLRDRSRRKRPAIVAHNGK